MVAAPKKEIYKKYDFAFKLKFRWKTETHESTSISSKSKLTYINFHKVPFLLSQKIIHVKEYLRILRLSHTDIFSFL